MFNINIVRYEEKFNNMKMDIILMNPPYDGSLHLKFLEKAIQISEKVVSVQPVDNLINMNVANKLSSNLMKYIEDIYRFSTLEINKYFKILSSSRLGIITASKDNHIPYKFDNHEMYDIVKRLRKQKSIRSSLSCSAGMPKEKYWIGVLGDYGYAKTWHYTLEDIFTGKPNAKMGFNTQEELDNFVDSVKHCWPYKLMYIIDDYATVIAHLPFMNDYTHKWNDDDFYNFFNVSKEEKEEIENFIDKKYKENLYKNIKVHDKRRLN